jgi:chemotaxis methyl-accepting protein methylase
MSKETEKCVDFMQLKVGLDISMYDTSFLEKVIQSRMADLSCESTEDYLLFLGKLPAESTNLLDQLSNSYSEFFRNPLTFAYLEQIVLPMLVAQKVNNGEKEIRIWSAACASGQEAYSIAMLCDELLESTKSNIAFRIFATDKNHNELGNAQLGVYQLPSLSKVSLNRIQKYFTQQGESFTIAPKLKKYIDFSFFDLLAENGSCPPSSIYGNFDLAFCSNLLFYYKPEYRKRIIDKTLHCIALGGYMVTGESEREIVKDNSLCEVFVNSGIFQKRLKLT